MSYLSILPLEEAKNYLRLDDDLTQDDNLVTGMIIAAFQYLEMRTNHIMFARNKKYYVGCDGIDIYDYPINSVFSPTEYTDLRYSSRVHYRLTNDGGEIELNVGYSTIEEVPQVFKQVALQIIDFWYYQNEKKIDQKGMPELLQHNIDVYRRFV